MDLLKKLDDSIKKCVRECGAPNRNVRDFWKFIRPNGYAVRPRAAMTPNNARFSVSFAFQSLFKPSDGLYKDHFRNMMFRRVKDVAPSVITQSTWFESTRTKLTAETVNGRGSIFEKDALSLYAKDHKCTVLSDLEGVNPYFPFLISQCDGVVFKNGKLDRLLEVKVPHVARREGDIFSLLRSRRMSWLNIEREDPFVTEESFFKLQLPMYVFNVKRLDLMLYTPVDMSYYIITVNRDDLYCQFYMEGLFNLHCKYLDQYF